MDATADYAIVQGGINDPNYVTRIGSLTSGFDDALDDTTYYGAFESMLKQLITRFAGKKIGYIAIPKMSSVYDSRKGADNFYHIALECCEKWGVPVCDLNTCVPPIGRLDELSDAYTTDGIHPNEAGYRAYYCDQIEAWMKNLTTTGRSTKAIVKEHNENEESHSDIRALIAELQNGKLNSNGVSIKKALLPLADGTTLEVDVLVASAGVIVVPFTNQVPISIDTDGSVYQGVGYLLGYRLSSSGAIKADTAYNAVTGFIPAKGGDTIRIDKCDWFSPKSVNYICAYDSNFTFIGAVTSNVTKYGTQIHKSVTMDGTRATIELADVSNIAYIRISALADGDITGGAVTNGWENGADMIVTVNEDFTI
jgi:hypothetical protein